MTNTFLTRVSAERRVLAVVNEKMVRTNQLTGLSSAAISRWRTKIGFECTSTIYPILACVAELCQRLSDRSHETFLPLEAAHSEEIERQVSELRQRIAKCL